MKPLDLLQPGDLICYKPHGFFGWVITVKTWHKVSHCEIFRSHVHGKDEGFTYGSRDGEGVGCYLFNKKKIQGIYRPNRPFDFGMAETWYWKKAHGQKYDWKGILGFTFQNDGAHGKMFCSEFSTRFYRQGGFDPFPREDADKVAPFQFIVNPFFDKIY